MVQPVIAILRGRVRKRRPGYCSWFSYRRDGDVDSPYYCAKVLATNGMGFADVA